MDVRVETLALIHVACIRHDGPYSEVDPCFDRLFRWAAGLGVPTGRVLTLSYGDPEDAAPDRMRCDACVELHKHSVARIVVRSRPRVDAHRRGRLEKPPTKASATKPCGRRRGWRGQ